MNLETTALAAPESRVPHPAWEISSDTNLVLPPEGLSYVLASHSGDRNPFPDVANRFFGGEGAGELTEQYEGPQAEAFWGDTSDRMTGAVPLAIYRQNPNAALYPTHMSRIAGNFNGTLTGQAEEPMVENFVGVPIFREGGLPSFDVRRLAFEEGVIKRHKVAVEAITQMALAANLDTPLMIVDFHDTNEHALHANGKLGEQELHDPQGNFWHFGHNFILLSDRDGATSHPKVTHAMGEAIAAAFIEDGLIDLAAQPKTGMYAKKGYLRNVGYWGGQAVKRYGQELPQQMARPTSKRRDLEALKTPLTTEQEVHLRKKAGRLYAIQLEIDRSLWASGSDMLEFSPERTGRVVAAFTRGCANGIDSLMLPSFGEVHKERASQLLNAS